MKRFRDAGVTNLDQWSDCDILRFSQLPTDIMKMILSTYLNVSDIDRVCQAIGDEWCNKYHIFQFIFISRYGGQLWEDLHSHQPGRFPSDKSFLRAYELFHNLPNVRIRLVDERWNIAEIYVAGGNDCAIMYRPVGQNVLNLQIDSMTILNPRVIPQMAFVIYLIKGYRHSQYDMVVLFYDLMERFSIVYVANITDNQHRYFLESSCGSCGKSDPPFKCGNCGKVAYCGQICQSAHWTEHSCQ